MFLDRKWGQPIPLPKEKFEEVKRQFENLQREDRVAQEDISDDEIGIVDHIEQSEDDCGFIFLSECLLPALERKDTVTFEEVSAMATVIIEKFAQEYPKDFDLEDTEDVLLIAYDFVFYLRFLYHTDEFSKKQETQHLRNLLCRANIILVDAIQQTYDEEFGDDDEDYGLDDDELP